MARMSFDDCEQVEPNKYKLVLMVNRVCELLEKNDLFQKQKHQKITVKALSLIASREIAEEDDDDLYYQ